MTALLEVPAIRQRFSPLTVADYHHLGEFNENGRRTELVRGIVIEKDVQVTTALHHDRTRAGNPLAGQIQPGWLLRQEGPLTLADSEPEPDVAVVLGPRGAFNAAHPTTAELVVEVAVSSLEIDRVKAQIYAEAGVKEYWIVCPEEKRVEVYRQPGANGYAERTMIAPPEVIACAALPGVRVDLTALFV